MQGVMRTPRSVDIDITNRCNLRCEYCYHFSSEGDVYEDLPAEEWLRFFDELGRCSVMTVQLAGGEPFARKDLFDLIDGIVRNRMRYAVLSNGTLITDEVAEQLAGTGRCDYVQVSIDGSCADVHDTCRGRGSFEKAVTGIRTLQRHAVPVAVRFTIHHRNVHDLEDAARFLLEDLGLSSFSTNAASYFGLCREHSAGVSLTVEDRERAMKTLLMLDARYGGRISATAGPLADARMWSEMIERHEKGESATTDGGGFLTSCGCPTTSIAVRADGVIVPCTLLSMIELGRINHDPLREVWQDHPDLVRFRGRRTISLLEFEECRSCRFSLFCRGGCPGLSASQTGSVFRPAPDTCLRLFLEAGGEVPSPAHER